MLSSGRRPTTPDERVHNFVVGLGGASTTCRRSGWDDRPARIEQSAPRQRQPSRERGVRSKRVANMQRARECETARGSRCARIGYTALAAGRSTSPSKASVSHVESGDGIAHAATPLEDPRLFLL